MRTNEFPVSVLIDDLLLSEGHPVAPVQRADVVLHRLRHLLPVVLDCRGREERDTELPGSASPGARQFNPEEQVLREHESHFPTFRIQNHNTVFSFPSRCEEIVYFGL